MHVEHIAKKEPNICNVHINQNIFSIQIEPSMVYLKQGKNSGGKQAVNWFTNACVMSLSIFFSSILFPCSLVFIWDLTLRAQGIDWDSRKKLSRKPSDPGPLNVSAVWETVHRLPRCFPRFSIPHGGFQAMNLAIGCCTSVLENVSDYPTERLFEISQTFETTQPWSVFSGWIGS